MKNSKIINKFFTNELSSITEKYNKLDDKTIQKIEEVMNKIYDEDFKQKLYSDFDEVMRMINEMEDDFEEAILNIYVFMNRKNEFINVSKAREIYEQVNYNGYYSDGDIIIYSRLQDIEEYVKENIHDIMSNSYEVDRLFDKETLIDYLIDGKGVEDIEKDMVENYDEYTSILDITPEIIYSDKNNNIYYYAQLEI